MLNLFLRDSQIGLVLEPTDMIKSTYHSRVNAVPQAASLDRASLVAYYDDGGRAIAALRTRQPHP